VLRGYAQDAFRGRRFLHANAEYRFPLAHPQRGYRTLPLYLRHLHGAVFADAGHAWNGGLVLKDVKAAAGAGVVRSAWAGWCCWLPRSSRFGGCRRRAEALSAGRASREGLLPAQRCAASAFAQA
jgi:hypothetical protein